MLNIYKKQLFPLIIWISLTTSLHAQENNEHAHLTAQEIERLKVAKEQLGDVDPKSLWQTVRELEKTGRPEINLEMKEAMAKAYTDIVSEIGVEGQKKKEWLYSMVCLNMAYLQFGGEMGKYGSTTELNRLIRQKLIKYLPPDVLKRPGFSHSLG